MEVMRWRSSDEMLGVEIPRCRDAEMERCRDAEVMGTHHAELELGIRMW
jgi:hypothetical protein